MQDKLSVLVSAHGDMTSIGLRGVSCIIYFEFALYVSERGPLPGRPGNRERWMAFPPMPIIVQSQDRDAVSPRRRIPNR